MKCLSALLLFISACEHIEVVKEPEVVNEVVKPMQFNECLKAFNNNEHKRKAPPLDFLNDLYVWIKVAPEFLYARNSEPRDAFSHLASYLGINKDSTLKYRQAALFELMRVSAAMESSFNWQEERDKAASNYTYYTMESGIFQSAPNTHIYAHKGNGYQRWAYLDKLVAPYISRPVHINDEAANKEWNALMKDETKKHVIFEHHAFMVRHNFHHYGPIRDGRRVGMNINKECIKEVESML
jgi:hypothetical protein